MTDDETRKSRRDATPKSRRRRSSRFRWFCGDWTSRPKGAPPAFDSMVHWLLAASVIEASDQPMPMTYDEVMQFAPRRQISHHESTLDDDESEHTDDESPYLETKAFAEDR